MLIFKIKQRRSAVEGIDKFLQTVFTPREESAEVEHLLWELKNALSWIEIDTGCIAYYWKGGAIPMECWERTVLSCISQLKELGAGGKAETVLASWREERAIRNAPRRQPVERAIEEIPALDEL